MSTLRISMISLVRPFDRKFSIETRGASSTFKFDKSDMTFFSASRMLLTRKCDNACGSTFLSLRTSEMRKSHESIELERSKVYLRTQLRPCFCVQQQIELNSLIIALNAADELPRLFTQASILECEEFEPFHLFDEWIHAR